MVRKQGPDYEFSARPIVENSGEEMPEEITKQIIIEEEALEEEVLVEKEIKKVPVYICGAVHHPGVYYLYEADIIQDAIKMAGGFALDANQDIWNLAMEIQKGMKIYVPKEGEQIDKTHISYDNSISDTGSLSQTTSLVNINRAGVQELTVLPGIGPVTAENIVTYRNTNGEFESLQDVKNVPRIGQVTFEKIKDHICLQ